MGSTWPSLWHGGKLDDHSGKGDHLTVTRITKLSPLSIWLRWQLDDQTDKGDNLTITLICVQFGNPGQLDDHSSKGDYFLTIWLRDHYPSTSALFSSSFFPVIILFFSSPFYLRFPSAWTSYSCFALLFFPSSSSSPLLFLLCLTLYQFLPSLISTLLFFSRLSPLLPVSIFTFALFSSSSFPIIVLFFSSSPSITSASPPLPSYPLDLL